MYVCLLNRSRCSGYNCRNWTQISIAEQFAFHIMLMLLAKE